MQPNNAPDTKPSNPGNARREIPQSQHHHLRVQTDCSQGFRSPPDEHPTSGPPVGGPASLDEDFFGSFMDMEKIGSENGEVEEGDVVGTKTRPRHKHCISDDWGLAVFNLEAKRAMDADKLAELATVDPKRAKRFCRFFVLHSSFLPSLLISATICFHVNLVSLICATTLILFNFYVRFFI